MFSDLVGHEAAIRLLTSEIAKGRLAPSYLFTGLRGIGKRSLGLAFAQALLCQAPDRAPDAGQRLRLEEAAPRPSGQACGGCPACLGVGAGTFPDLIAVSPEASTESESLMIRIDQVRRLTNGLRLTPHTSRWKVGLVEEADQITDEAAHALLKLVEEPPERSVLLFTSSASYRLAPTFISRCQPIRCWPQGIGRVAEFLEKREKLIREMARGLAVWSGGRAGLALRWHQGNGLAQKNLLLDELLLALRQGAVETPLGSGPRHQMEEALDGIAAWWRDLLFIRLKADRSWIIHQDRLGDLEKEAAGSAASSIESLVERLQRTYQAQRALQGNASPRMALAVALMP